MKMKNAAAILTFDEGYDLTLHVSKSPIDARGALLMAERLQIIQKIVFPCEFKYLKTTSPGNRKISYDKSEE